jgi:hypothetical protein
VIPEAIHFQFFVAVTPGIEMVLSGFCILSNSKYDNPTDLNLDDVTAILWI